MMHQRSALGQSGKQFRAHNISQTVQKIVISPIKEMSILADLLEDEIGHGTVISFGQGIPYFDTPNHIKDAIHTALHEPDTAKYTLEPGITELRELLARHLEQSRGISRIQAKQEIMVTAGCQEAVACALRSIIDPGDEVILPSPCFASHIEQVIQFGGTPVFAPLVEKNGWSLDVEACARRVTPKTKAILFSNPSNPTGAVCGVSELRALADLAKEKNLIMITDETYDFLTYDAAAHRSPAAFEDVRDRVILCGSFSKKYAMTGYRVGYAYADKGIIDHMLKVHDALTICAPAISQKAAIAALAGPQDSVQDFREKLAENRKNMCQNLDTLSDSLSYQKPRGAYYILAKILHPELQDSFQTALRILNEARVIVIPGAAFGPQGEGHVRLSFAGEPNQIPEGFRRLAAFFKDAS
ncbi:pyridoxal phosphate-dependent aminotransferase [Candidatus Uhrbacteria bacterium]|nr:pyridoxal phosphate-dependent aminotransferase [Candidatus Uhrbacteria bacterium]